VPETGKERLLAFSYELSCDKVPLIVSSDYKLRFPACPTCKLSGRDGRMATKSKLGPGRRVHCGMVVPNRTWDHVFPRGWYPEDTPRNLEKWKVPACLRCNAEYGRIEEELGILIALCIGPGAPNAKGMYRKALRSMDPSRGRNFKDRVRREQKRQKVLQRLIKGRAIPDEGAYPGLEERWGRPREEQLAVHVPSAHLHRLVEKIVKGIAFIEDGRYVDSSAEIKHHVITQEGAEPLLQLLQRHGKIHSRAPGIEVLRAVTPEDGVSAIYKMTIWGQLVMYASVLRTGAKQR